MSILPKSIRDFRYRLFYRLLLNRQFNLTTLGNPESECGWTFCPTGLNAKSVVYSGGVGGDISFEHGLVKHFGCEIILFDPSPTGLQTMARTENQVSHFHFFPVALSSHSGQLTLAKPLNREGDWWLSKDNNTKPGEGCIVECADLRSLMEKNGHNHIDLLKLDIEGSEYGVIDDLLKHRIPVRQICVEFHNGNLPGIRRRQTIRSIFKLLARGYKLVDCEGGNHTFLRP
jgi:FkbM family methyltransferase